MTPAGIALITQHPDLRDTLRSFGRLSVALEAGSVATAIEAAVGSVSLGRATRARASPSRSLPARVVGLILARLEDPARLGALADRALGIGCPVVALPLGMPPDHEGALHALARQHALGIATNLDSLLDACVALAASGPPRGPRVAIVCGSDPVASDLAGLAALRGLDLGRPRRSPIVGGRGKALVRALEPFDIIALAGIDARLPRSLARERTVVRAEVPAAATRHRVAAASVVRGCERLVGVLRVLQALGRARARGATRTTPRPSGIDVGAARAVLDGPARVLSEPSSKRSLAPYGIPFPREVLSTSASMAEQAARSLTPPLTAKIASPDLLDKLGGEGILREISNRQRARAAYHALVRAAVRARADARILGVLLSETARGVTEVRLRSFRDPTLGLLVSIGASGTARLALSPDPVILLPARRADVEDLVATAPVARYYDGSSGREPGDKRALADAILRLAAFASDFVDEVSEVLLDPVVVRPKGQGVVATDARVSVSPR